jgi:hypothetical protein
LVRFFFYSVLGWSLTISLPSPLVLAPRPRPSSSPLVLAPRPRLSSSPIVMFSLSDSSSLPPPPALFVLKDGFLVRFFFSLSPRLVFDGLSSLALSSSPYHFALAIMLSLSDPSSLASLVAMSSCAHAAPRRCRCPLPPALSSPRRRHCPLGLIAAVAATLCLSITLVPLLWSLYPAVVVVSIPCRCSQPSLSPPLSLRHPRPHRG